MPLLRGQPLVRHLAMQILKNKEICTYIFLLTQRSRLMNLTVEVGYADEFLSSKFMSWGILHSCELRLIIGALCELRRGWCGGTVL